MSTVHDAFTSHGIGVVIGEYGLLGYDKGEGCNQPGEELKYYEYMNELSRKHQICLMFWDNGSGIDRVGGTFQWKKPLVGEMLEASMKGRSSYVTDLDTLYFDQEAEEDVELALTLNGNTFQEIQGLAQGTDYTWDEKSGTVTLKKEYINQVLEVKKDTGLLEDLVFRFSSGADWHQKLVRFATPVFGEASGTAEEGLTIPVQYNGANLRRVSAFSGEDHTGPHSDWCSYLEHSYAYFIDEAEGTLTLDSRFFDECAEGQIRFVVEFFDGQTGEFWVTKDGNSVSASPDPVG